MSWIMRVASSRPGFVAIDSRLVIPSHIGEWVNSKGRETVRAIRHQSHRSGRGLSHHAGYDSKRATTGLWSLSTSHSGEETTSQERRCGSQDRGTKSPSQW